MPKALLLAVLTVLLLQSACALQGPTGVARTPTPTVDIELATSTPIRQTSASAVPTSSLEACASEYRDTRLCFSVKVLAGWTADGVRGGFAWFAPATGQSSFNITNVALEETTLARALGEVQRGPLASYVQDVKDFVVAGQPALWVAFAPGAEFQFVVLVIAPDCGDGPHALFISATEADQRSFESFLSYVGFISS
jgi:hypothetical protein